jgi:hypothetical protein
LTCCSGIPIPPGDDYCGTICPDSDRNLKAHIVAADPEAVLKAVEKLPLSYWSYKVQPEVRHLGPMAQDFMASFALGGSDRAIHKIDADGVALAAIQALAKRVDDLARENKELKAEVQALRARK